MIDYNSIWFNPLDYGIDTLVAGDELVIKYTGEYITQEIYPGNVISDKMHIQSIEVIEADIVEFKVLATHSSNELSLVPVDSKYNNYVLLNQEGYVISKDETFKKYNNYSIETTLYATLPKTTGSIRVDGLYDYNPRNKKIEPMKQFKVEIINGCNSMIDNLSNDSGMYTTGSILKFYFNPIMDVDLAMYVNNEFYDIQTSKKHDEGYIWEYIFVMPDYDVIIEFKIESLEYLDVKGILDIPFLTVNDVKKVRYEHGYIGVAPGSFTDIKYSTDYEDVNSVLTLLEMPVYEEKGNNWQVCGGSYSCYSIITENKQYDIYISNGYISVNKKYYKFIGEYINFEYPSIEAHSFITYIDTYEVYTLDNIKIGNFDGLSKYEFIKYPHEDVFENEDLGHIETEFGKVYIHSDKTFYIKENNVNTYYLIIGEKDFANAFLK